MPKCPECGKNLKNGPMREFETLSDHVLDPNEEIHPRFPRKTWVCRNFFCNAFRRGFWSQVEGGWYTWRKQDKNQWVKFVDFLFMIDTTAYSKVEDIPIEELEAPIDESVALVFGENLETAKKLIEYGDLYEQPETPENKAALEKLEKEIEKSSHYSKIEDD